MAKKAKKAKKAKSAVKKSAKKGVRRRRGETGITDWMRPPKKR